MLAYPVSSSDDKLTMLSSKIEVYLQEKGWRLEDKMVWDDVVYYYWQNGHELIKVSFFYLGSEQEAAKRMQKDTAGIGTKFGPGIKVEGMGDEGYEWTGLKEGQALVNMRKGRVIVAVVGQSIETARQVAKKLAELIAGGLSAQVAA
jgi:hypothetical protein